MKKRIVSMFLAVIMIFGMIPQDIVRAAVTSAISETDVKENVDCTAVFNPVYLDGGTIPVCENPEEVTNWYDAPQVMGSQLNKEMVVIIRDVYIDTAQNVYWYKVEAAQGTVLPDIMAKNSWVFQNFVGESADYDSLLINPKPAKDSVFDQNGNPVSAIALPEHGKVNLTAKSALTGDVEYQWEILDPVSNEWVDIYNETTAELPVTYALVKNLLDKNGTAQLRYSTSAGANQAVSSEVKVTVQYDASSKQNALTPAVVDNAETETGLQAAAFGLLKSSTAGAIAPLADYVSYNIVIHYVDEKGDMVFEDHVESWPSGQKLTHSITVPVKVGYDIYFGDTKIEKFDLATHVGTLDSNKEFTIVYKPAMVKYKVHYLFQNVTNDAYVKDASLHATETREGLTGSMTEFDTPEIEGFNFLYYDKVEIAADGSTEIEIYYDREYYLISFELGSGGYGTEPVYARYGANVVVPVPTRSGWTFAGWDPDISIINGAYQLTVRNNITYTALWNRGASHFTVVFWKENAEPNKDASGNVLVDSSNHPVYGYSYWTHKAEIPATTGDVINGADYKTMINDLVSDEQYFTFNPGKTDSGVVVEGDGTTVVNLYYTRNEYTIYFYAEQDSCSITNHTHTDACYQYICDKVAHEHNENCLECTLEEHSHADNCCSKTEHTHNSDCCNIDEHTHSSNCCSIESHAHTKQCYSRYADDISNTPSSLQNYIGGQKVEGYVYQGRSNKYIYISGLWYEFDNSSVRSGTTLTPDCGETIHVHGTGCNTSKCQNQTEHTHGNGCSSDDCSVGYEHTHNAGACNGCVKTIHKHDVSCYSSSCAGNGTEHKHESTCARIACNQVEHTHGSNCPTRGYSDYHVVKVITAKYDSDISAIWPTADTITGLGYWSATLTDGDTVQQSSRVVTMNSDWSSDNDIHATAKYYDADYQLNYWFEDINQTSTPTNTTDVRTYYNNKYYIKSTKYSQTAYYSSNQNTWSYKTITGMVATASTAYNDNDTFNLYYNRSEHKVTFVNADKTTVAEYSKVKYGAYVKDLTYTKDGQTKSVTTLVPEYPSEYEPNAYEFDGWYTTPQCFDGTKVDWNTFTVPNDDTILYAKWVPTTHNVRVWLDSTMSTQIGTTQAVKHNDPAQAPGTFDKGKYEKYSHAGWFYIDVNGEEKAFVFNNMPVHTDLDIYAKWSSTTAVQYKVHYVLGAKDADGNFIQAPQLNANGEPIYVAESTYGTKLAGRSVTFNAKAGTDLYSYFQGTNGKFYFPHTNNHTILMSVDEDNTFTFYYYEMDLPGYTVQYLDKATGLPLIGNKVVEAKDNKKAVVTETFVKIDEYMPDAYQKTLIISANESENVITFWYEKDETHAFYRVNHLVEQLDGSYKLFSYFEGPGNIGQPIPNINKAEIYGYTYEGYMEGEHDVVTITKADPPTHTLTADGYLVNLYYNLNEYPYIVKYLEMGTDKELAASDKYLTPDLYKKYGDTFSATAKDIAGYNLVSAQSQSKVIDVEENLANPVNNVIVFYYVEQQVTINYVVIPPVVGGTLTRYSEVIDAVTEQALGSAPTAGAGYKFVGWYFDEECTQSVPDSWVDANGQIDPQADKGSNPYVEDTYYALFTYVCGDLTINKTVTQEYYGDQRGNAVFTFKVEGVITEANDGSYTVMVGNTEQTVTVTDGKLTLEGVQISVGADAENGSITLSGLPMGSYTVTETNVPEGYTAQNATATETVTANGDVSVDFVNKFNRVAGTLTITKEVQQISTSEPLPAVTDFKFFITMPEAATGTLTYIVKDKDGNIVQLEGKDERTATISDSHTATISLDAGQTAEIIGAPIGSYMITELKKPGFNGSFGEDTIKRSDGSVAVWTSVSKATTTSVVCTNEYPVYTGTLQIEKTVLREDYSNILPGHSYEMVVTLTPILDAMQVDRPYVVTINKFGGGTEVINGTIAKGTTDSVQITFSMGKDDKAVITGLPVGSYTVTENLGSLADDYGTPDIKKGTGEILASRTVYVDVINTYKDHTGDLTINKEVNVEYTPDTDDWSANTFTFTVNGTTTAADGKYTVVVNGVSREVTVSNGNVTIDNVTVYVDKLNTKTSVSITGLPIGEYTVTETNIPEGYSCENEDNKDTATVTATVAGSASFVNTFDKLVGNLEIFKTVEKLAINEPLPVLTPFEFVVTVPSDVNENLTYKVYMEENGVRNETVIRQATVEPDGNKITLKLRANEVAVFENLPIGSYTVTEIKKAGFNGSFGDGSVANNDGSVSLTVNVTNGGTAVAPCHNAYPVYTGTLRVDKVVTLQNSQDIMPDDSFNMVVTLKPIDDSVQVDRPYTVTIYNAEGEKQSETSGTILLGDTSVLTLNFALKNGWYAEIKGLPVGDYTVNESAVSDDYAAPTYDANQNGYISAGNTLTTVVTNTYKNHKGSLQIDKTVTKEYANDIFTGADFTFTVNGTTTAAPGSYTVLVNGTALTTPVVVGSDKKVNFTVTVPVTNIMAGSITVTDLPIGTYTVTENELAGYTLKGDNDLSADVNAETTAKVEFANQFDRLRGNLVVNKLITELSQAVKPDYNQEFTFTVTLNVTDDTKSTYVVDYNNKEDITVSGTSFDITLKHGESAVIKGLPAGGYTITEAAVEGFKADWTIDSNLILANGVSNVTCQNSYPVYEGTLVIGKTVVKNHQPDHWNGDTFTYNVSGTVSHAAAGTYTITVGGENKEITVDENNNVNFTVQLAVPANKLVEEQTLTIAGLPIGSYTVSEVVTDDYTLEGSNDLAANVNSTNPVKVAFKNVYNTHQGDLTINKVVDLDYDKDSWNGDTFTFSVVGQANAPIIPGDYTVYVNGTAYTAVVAADGKVTMNDVTITVTELNKATGITINNLPVGSYTVTEAADDDYTVEDGDYSKVVTVNAETAATAQFVNIYKKQQGDLTIDKTVVKQNPKDVWNGGSFTFTVVPAQNITLSGDYTVMVGGSNTTVTASDNKLVVSIDVAANQLGTAQSVTVKDLPLGSYTVVETADAEYTQSAAEVSATVVADNSAKAEFTNTYINHLGTLTVTKKVDNYSKIAASENQSFIFHIVGNDSGNSHIDMKVVVPVSQIVMGNGQASVVVGDLPMGSYTVTEDTAWTWRYTLTESDVSDTTLTLEDMSGSASFTNTYKEDGKWLNYSYHLDNVFTASNN